ncbi:hypothetical protein [Sphingomonas profundi]|uniref:hypothetical protein n=1 Tax=Alterirhizorhabdus profundi TaxID=2681549 RepID=UPI0012E71860|nr:hypothetical protein [Sphingomonas profundi]
MSRAALLLLGGAMLVAGCGRQPAASGAAPEASRDTPAVVAIRVSPSDTSRYRAVARRCGAAGAKLQRSGEATLLVVGLDSSAAARDCFFAAAAAEHRRAHPIAAFIEGLFR